MFRRKRFTVRKTGSLHFAADREVVDLL